MANTLVDSTTLNIFDIHIHNFFVIHVVDGLQIPCDKYISTYYIFHLHMFFFSYTCIGLQLLVITFDYFWNSLHLMKLKH